MADSLKVQNIPEIVDVDQMSEEEKKRAVEIANSIDINDTQAVITFGVGAQREISEFSDTILSEIRSKDTGQVGVLLSDLVVNVKDLNVDSLGQKQGFLAGLPLIGGFMDKVKHFMARYDKLSVQIEKITDELDKARMNLLRDITMMDNLYEKNLSYLKNLDAYIAGGQLKLKQLVEEELPAMKKKAEESSDAMDAQKYNDFAQFVNRFEKKLYDLKLSRTITIQTAPQVRLIQNGNQTLVEKIQSSILNTIPLWKNQIVIAIALFRQKKAVELQKKVSDTTNDLLKKNSDMLKNSTLDIVRESERGIVEIETLKKVNENLISTIEETLKIQQEGKLKRQAAEQELVKIEQELKNKLVEAKA